MANRDFSGIPRRIRGGERIKIKTKTTLESNEDSSRFIKKGDIRNIEVVQKVYCCDEMESAMQDKFVIFGNEDRFLNQDNHLNLIKTFCYPSGTAFDELAISFCPFCGAKIEIENIETVWTQ